MRRAWVTAVAVLLLSALPAGADTLQLPTPEAARVQQAKLIVAVGGRPDRLLTSEVPGPVINDELVRVGLGGDGSVRSVTAEQRLRLTGEGDYAIRERGPARSAVSLSADPPPVTRRGAVVWQGFSPGRRDLAAALTLDPQIESTRLPLTVQALSLESGGVVPKAGAVTITITNTTEQPADLPTARDASASAVAAALDRALKVARTPSAGRLPTTGTGLPAALPVTGGATTSGVQAVPYRLTGSLKAVGATARISGPTIRPDGTFAGTLGGSRAGTRSSVTFTAVFDGPGRLVLDLTAVATLNATELTPPRGLPTWAAWALTKPVLSERRAALDLLVAVAATGARASSYGPYLGADLVGSGSTTFRYAFAPAPVAVVVKEPLRPRWGAISLAGFGLLLLLSAAVVVWRRN